MAGLWSTTPMSRMNSPTPEMAHALQVALESLRQQSLRIMRRRQYENVRVLQELKTLQPQWSLRGLKAGQVRIRSDDGPPEILLNPGLWRFGLDEVRETLAHELAHVLVWYLAQAGDGRARRASVHGALWRSIAEELGCSGRTTHDLPLKKARRARWHEYALDETLRIWIGPVRHRRIQSGRYRYTHRPSGQPIRADHYTGKSELR